MHLPYSQSWIIFLKLMCNSGNSKNFLSFMTGPLINQKGHGLWTGTEFWRAPTVQGPFSYWVSLTWEGISRWVAKAAIVPAVALAIKQALEMLLQANGCQKSKKFIERARSRIWEKYLSHGQHMPTHWYRSEKPWRQRNATNQVTISRVPSWEGVHEIKKETLLGTSLVAQWLRIHLPMQETRVRSLVRDDPTCHGATKPVRHNYCSPRA